jgi:hypothetical protein
MLSSSWWGSDQFTQALVPEPPNARRELLLEAGATQERTLEAVSSRPLFK